MRVARRILHVVVIVLTLVVGAVFFLPFVWMLASSLKPSWRKLGRPPKSQPDTTA